MAVSKRAEKERLEKERLKKVGEKILNEQISSNKDLASRIDRAISWDSKVGQDVTKKEIAKGEADKARGLKEAKSVWNSDQNKYVSVPSSYYTKGENNLAESKPRLEEQIRRNKTMSKTDYGMEAIADIKRENEKKANQSMDYPGFKSNPTSRRKSEVWALNIANNNERLGNALFGANNKFSAWADKTKKATEKKITNRQYKDWFNAKEEYYNPGFGGSNSGYEKGTGRPVSEKVGEYMKNIKLEKEMQKNKEKLNKKYGGKK